MSNAILSILKKQFESLKGPSWSVNFISLVTSCFGLQEEKPQTAVMYGVPQGSILRPLLFLVFINDLCDSIELCGTSMYADDTAIFYLADCEDELQVSLQFDLQMVAYWMHENRLNLNTGKTKFMILGSIDAHIEKIVDKTTTKLGLLYKTRWLFDRETALMLYKSLIIPHFEFGSVIYEISLKYQLQHLQVIQNAAARLILLEDHRCPIYSLHERLQLDTLATRRAKSMVKLTLPKLN